MNDLTPNWITDRELVWMRTSIFFVYLPDRMERRAPFVLSYYLISFSGLFVLNCSPARDKFGTNALVAEKGAYMTHSMMRELAWMRLSRQLPF